MRSTDVFRHDRAFAWIAIIAVAGLVLRIAAGCGGLWLDEAWSALLAHEAGTPLGIFVQINHDNNHHLNSLWLQAVGLGAPPLVARALSIVAGTLSIVVAGMIGARRGAWTGVVTALLFALSPALVTLGSEARGYAPMMLMAMLGIWYVDQYLGGDKQADRPLTLAVLVFVGALFQLTMAVAVCALTGWVFAALARREGPRGAARKTARLLGPAFGALLIVLLIVAAPVIAGAEFRFGSRQPFATMPFVHGVGVLFGYAIGAPGLALGSLVAAMILLLSARALGTPRLPFYWLAIVVFPISVALLRMMNAEHPRYYLLAGIALLLLIGEILSALIRNGGWKALAGGTALAAFIAASMAANLDLIQNQRGDVGPAIRAVAARAPHGADVMLERETGLALVKVAAAEAGYPVTASLTCPARFVFADSYSIEPEGPDRILRCGGAYRAIARATAHGLSGQNWTLYERLD